MASKIWKAKEAWLPGVTNVYRGIGSVSNTKSRCTLKKITKIEDRKRKKKKGAREMYWQDNGVADTRDDFHGSKSPRIAALLPFRGDTQRFKDTGRHLGPMARRFCERNFLEILIVDVDDH